jgi:tryptophan synthase beta chain
MSSTGTQYKSQPNIDGYFGDYGGRFVSETLVAALDELTCVYNKLSKDPAFKAQLDNDLANYVGRPSPLYHAQRLSEKYQGAQIYLKREDLNHTGAHKINNTMGQGLLAKYLGKP